MTVPSRPTRVTLTEAGEVDDDSPTVTLQAVAD